MLAFIYMVDDRKPTRIRYMFGEDGTKVRVAKKSGSVIPYPEEMKKRRTPRSTGIDV